MPPVLKPWYPATLMPGVPHFVPFDVSGTVDRQSGIPCKPKSAGDVDP
jgi:hypothetical protein